MNLFFRIPQKIDMTLAKGTIGIIKVYQKTVSPDHSELGKCDRISGCKFHPSCSEYAILALKKNGFVIGVPRTVWRILRCNPWSKGGIDLP